MLWAMATATKKRPAAIDRARNRYKDNPHAPYEYPDLPAPSDAALAYYCVYLAYPDGTFPKGPHPAFCRERQATIVDSEAKPFIDPGFTMATTIQQQNILENLRPAVAKDQDGNPIQIPAREWILQVDKNQRYYEDPRIAAKSAAPFVRKIELYCPVKDAVSGGALEDHGPYLGTNAEVADDFDGVLGVCEKCAGDHARTTRALRAIKDLHESASQPMSEALARRVSLLPAEAVIREA